MRSIAAGIPVASLEPAIRWKDVSASEGITACSEVARLWTLINPEIRFVSNIVVV